MDGHSEFTTTRLQADLYRDQHLDAHHPPAPSSEEEGELGLSDALAARVGLAPSTIPDPVRHGPPPAVGEDLLASAPAASSASLREPRHDLFTPDRQAQFQSALAESGSVRAACARVGVSPQTVYLHRRRSARFAAAWDGALVLARQVAEDVLAYRAIEGVEEPVFYRGEQIGSRVRFDARLLLAHLARLDAHVARSVHGERRAARFDELLALIAGAEPPEGLLPPGDPELDAPPPRAGRWDAGPADPQLPPERADFVDAMVEDLPERASQRRVDRCAVAAHHAWHDWRAAAEAWADRVTGPAAPVRRVVAAAEPSAEPVETPDPAPVSAPRSAPAPVRAAGEGTVLRTLSGVSTSAPGAGMSGGLTQVATKQPGSSGNRERARFPDHPGLWSAPPSMAPRRYPSDGTL